MSIPPIQITFDTIYAPQQKECGAFSFLAIVAFTAIAMGVITLKAVHGVDVGSFHSLAGIGNLGGGGLISYGGVGLAALPTYIVYRYFSNKALMEQSVKENRVNFEGIFEILRNQPQMGHALARRPSGHYCMWSDPAKPLNQYLFLAYGYQRVVTIYRPEIVEDIPHLMEGAVEALDNHDIYLTPSPNFYKGLDIAKIQFVWAFEPKDQDLEIFEKHRDMIFNYFVDWKGRSLSEKITFEQSKLVFVLSAKGTERELHISRRVEKTPN